MEMMMERAIASVSFEAAETLDDVMLPTSSHPGFHSTDLPKDCWIIFAGLRRPRCSAQPGHLPRHHFARIAGLAFPLQAETRFKLHEHPRVLLPLGSQDPRYLTPFLTRLLCTLSPSHRSSNSVVQPLLPRRNRGYHQARPRFASAPSMTG
jgi:hypothetical protein